MNRRNFIGNLILTGASFFVLPAAKLERRIWVPDRRIITETATGSIWRDYYMSIYYDGATPPPIPPSEIKTVTINNVLWYSDSISWFKLKRLSHPLKFLDNAAPDPAKPVVEYPEHCAIQEI